MATKKRMTEADYKAQYMAEWSESLDFLRDYPDAANAVLSIKESQFDLKSYKRQLKRRAYRETEEYKQEARAFLENL